MKKRFHSSLEGLLFKVARTGTAREFEDTIRRMKSLHRAAGAYIEAIDPAMWDRAFSRRGVSDM